MLNQSIISNKLKHLYIYKYCVSIELLNCFDRLQQLDIIRSTIRGDQDSVLNLSNLKTFCAHYLDLQIDNLTFDLPHLQRLRIGSVLDYDFKMNLKDADNLDYLECKFFRSRRNFIRSAINLKHLYCYEIKTKDLDDNLLQNLIELKTISYLYRTNTFDELRRQKRLFNPKLKIYYRCVESIELTQFQFSRPTLKRQLIDYCLKNEDKLANRIPFINTIDYNDYEDYYNRMPINFLSKFSNFKRLLVHSSICNLNNLINLLKGQKTIIDLELY